ncbi:MAG: hypothetical protein COW16_08120 [Sphingomonadales bacterium CG12_big_fil_rev_8_21_14_0_65_65_10]|uniref:hypothetical protein n=1 Tax=Blastomonas marina TaxID=1867408 RepID=UPI000CBF9CCA|nr:hypothetical protein [Blastomonas marina]PIW55050.1 MAG: hypothetical protein COW16_08120 [Sphingomonadales bacterium CG12_big_fil_rev_8_21_14_0_65_65_10]WPZ04090.1 hypothetical protein T8S45_00735 [Blastomonas marina]
MKKLTSLLGALSLVGGATVAFAGVTVDRDWTIGPWIKGKNYSVGMPARPESTDAGIAIDFPTTPRSHVHYVTFDPGSLEGKSEIVMRYRIDAEPGTRFVPQQEPDKPGAISLFFQRRGDNWSARGRYEFYRWYAPTAKVKQLSRGNHEIRISLDDPEWISVGYRNPAVAPELFEAAKRDTAKVGFVLGSDVLRGHGVYATGPARMTVTGFEIR